MTSSTSPLQEIEQQVQLAQPSPAGAAALLGPDHLTAGGAQLLLRKVGSWPPVETRA
jgi:hypothetical protein